MTALQEQVLPLPRFRHEEYQVEDWQKILTPALLIYLERVNSNLAATLRLVGGNPDRLRPHVKTAKLAKIMRRMVEHGINNFKCSTTLELLTICGVGAKDVLLAYPAVGANAGRVRQIASETNARISVLVENANQVEQWRGEKIGLFIDVNPGMDRTGMEQERTGEIVELAHAIRKDGLAFRGLHYYDGHLGKFENRKRESIAHRGYNTLLKIVDAINDAGIKVEEVVTAGTPTFPCTISYKGFDDAEIIHRASPGTLVYCDCSSLVQLPADFGYQPAALVLSTVVSHPLSGRLTCDAGHKTVSADAGVPTCAVLNRDDLLPLKPSEEHLPIKLLSQSSLPAIGDSIYLVPRHVCPTVNNFDYALLVEGGKITSMEEVSARGRETPLR
jgi:D-serine deaminase-like pyridoxal phosphate-dependent protein